MKKLFDMDSPLMRGLSFAGDLLILNILTVLCSIPVITLGASLTGLYDTINRMYNGQGYSVKGFFAAFKSNFKQATALWILFCVIGTVLICSLLLSLQIANMIALVLRIVLCILVVLYLMALAWVFPLQAKFYNTVGNTLKNAFICAMSNRIRSLIAAVMNTIPIIFFVNSAEMFLKLSFLWVFFWLALAAYCNMKVLSKPFAELIDRSLHENEETTLMSTE